MTVEATVYTTLKADSTYNGLITGGLWPVILPDDVDAPAAAYSIVDIVPVASGSIGRARVQVDNFAVSEISVRSMRDALIDIANAQLWTYVIGPEMWDDAGKFFHLPVDLILVEGV